MVFPETTISLLLSAAAVNQLSIGIGSIVQAKVNELPSMSTNHDFNILEFTAVPTTIDGIVVWVLAFVKYGGLFGTRITEYKYDTSEVCLV